MALPYKNTDNTKKEQVEQMFDNIAPKYDFLNHFLSLGIDRLWRKKVRKELEKDQPGKLMDMATGTGDLAIELAKLNPVKIIGVDLSEQMLRIGRDKIAKKGLSQMIEMQKGDSEDIVYDASNFDAITCAFGVRNFGDVEKGLSEMYRVLKTGGKIVILEFSKPRGFLLKKIFGLYFNFILPIWGRLFSKDMSAYKYLPESVNEFPAGEDFLSVLRKIGFKSCRNKELTFGIASIYIGIK